MTFLQKNIAGRIYYFCQWNCVCARSHLINSNGAKEILKMLISLALFFTVGSKICFLGDTDNIKLFHQQIHGYHYHLKEVFFCFYWILTILNLIHGKLKLMTQFFFNQVYFPDSFFDLVSTNESFKALCNCI